jgi:hypothetical protein
MDFALLVTSIEISFVPGKTKKKKLGKFSLV